MRSKKAKQLRKALGGYDAIIGSKLHKIGVWTGGKSTIHFVDGKLYHLYKNMKRSYKRHQAFSVSV